MFHLLGTPTLTLPQSHNGGGAFFICAPPQGERGIFGGNLMEGAR